MSRELIGDLSKVRLLELVKPLADEKKSGMVVIEGASAAELYFEGGNIVHCKIDTLSGDEAVLCDYGLGRWSSQIRLAGLAREANGDHGYRTIDVELDPTRKGMEENQG